MNRLRHYTDSLKGTLPSALYEHIMKEIDVILPQVNPKGLKDDAYVLNIISHVVGVPFNIFVKTMDMINDKEKELEIRKKQELDEFVTGCNQAAEEVMPNMIDSSKFTRIMKMYLNAKEYSYE